MNEILTAILKHPKQVDIISPITGAVKRSITIDGTIVNGPIVVGDLCTLTIDLNNDTRETRVYKLASGAALRAFKGTK